MDISGFFNVYLSGVLNVAKKYYDTLDSLTFGGISVLDYAITLLILSVVVPMVITLVSSGVRSGYEEVTYSKRKEREIKREQIHEKKDAKATSNYNHKLSKQEGRRVARALNRGIRHSR